MEHSVTSAFRLYRTVLDQLPEAGFYVFFLKDGYNLIMPMTACETRQEAAAVEEREGHTKVVLDGKRPYRLWWLTEEEIVFVSEHTSRAEMLLRQSVANIDLVESGPSMPVHN